MFDSDAATTMATTVVLKLPVIIVVLGYKRVLPNKVIGVADVLGVLEIPVVGEPKVDASSAWEIKIGGC